MTQEKVIILAQSPDLASRKAHLYPIIDYLIAEGYTSERAEIEGDRYAFYDEKTGLVHSLRERIDWDKLLSKFTFPDSFEVGPKFGTIIDKANSLTIAEGLEPIPVKD